MNDKKVEFLKQSHLEHAETLVTEHPDIFSKEEFYLFKKDLLEYLKNTHDKNHTKVMVILVNNILCGAVLFRQAEDSPTYFKIEWFVIKKGEQDKGYGTYLIHKALSQIKQLNGKYVYIATSDEKHNDKTKAFYKKLGFQRSGMLPNYYPHPEIGRKTPEDRIVYYKEL